MILLEVARFKMFFRFFKNFKEMHGTLVQCNAKKYILELHNNI